MGKHKGRCKQGLKDETKITIEKKQESRRIQKLKRKSLMYKDLLYEIENGTGELYELYNKIYNK